ncbi:PAS domain-containing sensor histidine kinase [Paraburkholderia sp. RL17-373-BIF-A]|uniref:PAS domain-containing sensor histidine kinase n=1 Tax=Paraburkholderia sp. RL17-373-BIF-A TaxID=3031629 RepID=UPI0038BBD54A
MMPDAGVFERLAEPYLLLDCQLAPVAANGAWRARFGADADDSHGVAAHRSELDPLHKELIRSVSTGLCAGQNRLSPLVLLESRASAEGDTCRRPRYWQVFASFIPATECEPALVALRYDDVTARGLASEEPANEGTMMRPNIRRQSSPDGQPQTRYDSPVTQLGEMLALVGVGVWEMEAPTGGIRCSEQCLRHFGVAQSADVSSEWLLGGLPADIAANPAAPESGRPFELERKSPDGCHWILLRGIGRFNSDGTMQSVAGITHDLTSRKQRELELDALATAERSARERSEMLARTTDQFIAAVSHELRSPLNAVVSWAELLQLAMDPSHVARAGEAIRRNGRQLSHMVDDLLDSGAIATGKLSVNLQPVDLGALATMVAEDVRKLAQHKGLQLHAPDISPCLVMADESRMKQVMWNLLANAVKFTDVGEIEVSVRAAQGYAEMSVRDTGRGIETDALPLVFDRFEQIAPQASGRVGGLGLGLWLAKHIVSLHGGSIAVASGGPGCGAIFTVRIPLASTGR